MTALNIAEAAREVTLHIEIKGAKVFAFRLWLASKVFAFGAWVAGVNAEIEIAE